MTHSVNQNRVFGLDLFRAIAIVCVLLVHGGFLVEKALPGFPYFSIPNGVELFFVLSGFLIGDMLIRLVQEGKLRATKNLFHFWKRRWLRTLPAYYLVLLLNIGFAYMGWNNSKIDSFNWQFLLFTHNFVNPFTDFFWESWSLSIEEWFYIISPILLLVATSQCKGPYQTKWAILLSIIALLVLPLAYRFSISSQVLDPFWFDVTFRKTVMTRLDAIMYGVLIAWGMVYYKEHLVRLKWLLAATGALLFFGFKELIQADPTGLHAMTWHFSASGLGVALMLPIFVEWRSCSNVFGKIITHLSLISYSMYLINLGLVAQTIGHLTPPQNEIQSILYYLGFWLIVIGCSTLLYRYFEKPITELRDK